MRKARILLAKFSGKLNCFYSLTVTKIKRYTIFFPRRFPDTKIDQIKQIPLFLFEHKFWVAGISFFAILIIFMGVAVYRGYFMTTSDSTSHTTSGKQTQNKTIAAMSPKPTLVSPSPADDISPSVSTVLGTSSDESSDDDSEDTIVSEVPVTSPVPTDIPEPTETPVSTSNDDNSSSNSNCTTAAGVPNSWYSDVYPNPPVSTNNGSITLIVNIRDCNINKVSSSSTLKISLSSGDPNTQINGHTLPYSLTTQNGQASFSVSSQVPGTVVLVIEDTTDSFTVTNVDNNNPSIEFSKSPATPTPAPSSAPTPTQSVSPTAGSTPTISPVPTA
jgi:hypothetical protein